MIVESQPGYVYFTMAIFQNTHGLTDLKKPEFKITAVVTPVYEAKSTPVVKLPVDKKPALLEREESVTFDQI
mgnify:CR=1 FL=1